MSFEKLNVLSPFFILHWSNVMLTREFFSKAPFVLQKVNMLVYLKGPKLILKNGFIGNV